MDNYAKEEIPNEDSLYYRIHISNIKDGIVGSGAFRAKGDDGMSCDWDKYSNPEKSHSLSKDPNKNAIVALSVEEVREIQDLLVEHDPIRNEEIDNQAHSLVMGIPIKGPLKTKVRLKIKSIALWKIIPESIQIKLSGSVSQDEKVDVPFDAEG